MECMKSCLGEVMTNLVETKGLKANPSRAKGISSIVFMQMLRYGDGTCSKDEQDSLQLDNAS